MFVALLCKILFFLVTFAYQFQMIIQFLTLSLKVDRISTAVSDMGRSGSGIVPPPTSVSSSASQGAVSGRMTLRPYHPPQQTIYP